MPLPEISKIVVPALDGTSAGIYALKDAYARQLLSGGIEFRVVWDGNSTPVVANIPDAVSIRYNGTVYTGTLPASQGESMVFYLVKNDGEGSDSFAEYVVATDANNNTQYWEKIGDTGMDLSNLGALAYMDSVDIDKGLGAYVIGQDATLQAQSSSVSFASHTTDKVLGESTTFTLTDPVYSATLTTGDITLSRSTDAAINASTGSAVTGLSSSSSHKTTVLKSDTVFSRKKIKTGSIRGVTGSNTTASVTVTPTMQKLKTISITPATSKTVTPDIGETYGKLQTTSITGVSGSTSASNITNVGEENLVISTFKEVNQINSNNANANEWKDTTANLDFHMYSSGTDGSTGVFADADNETLVISFKTMPSLKLASSDTTYATGSITSQGLGDTVIKSLNYNAVTVPTAAQSATTVATGTVVATTVSQNVGSTVVSGVKPNSITVAGVGTAVTVATGAVTANSTEFGDETYGSQVAVGVTSASVSVPEIASQDTSVLIPETTTATTNTSDVNVITEVTTTGHTVDAYDTIAFESRSDLLKDTTTLTQPVFSASVTSAVNGEVVTGVTGITKTTAGSITVGTNDKVDAITALGAGTAAAQTVTFNNKDLKKVVLYDDLRVVTESHPATRYLNFVSPTNGNIVLTKIGTPTSVDLEISYDGVNWTDWTETSNTRTVAVTAGERLFIRNKSEVSTGFSTNVLNSYYAFTLPANTEVNGMLESLLCRTPELGVMSNSAFAKLFYSQRITGKPIINSTTVAVEGLCNTFDCSSLSGGTNFNSVELRATSIATHGLNNWLSGNSATGTVYCKSTLTITTNSDSGIPTGWTRVDI